MELYKLVNEWKYMKERISGWHQGLPGRSHLAPDAAGVAWRHVILRLDIQRLRVDLWGRWMLHGKEGLDGLDFTLVGGVS